MERMKLRWLGTAGAAAAVTVAVTLAYHPWATADTTAPPAASSGMKDTSALSSALTATLAKAGLVIDSPGASTNALSSPSVSSTQAADIGRANFGLDPDATAATATLATVTVTDMGRPSQPDPSKPATIAPTIDHRTLWVINFPSVQVPALGPVSNGAPRFSNAGMIALVDPTTGEFILGQSY